MEFDTSIVGRYVFTFDYAENTEKTARSFNLEIQVNFTEDDVSKTEYITYVLYQNYTQDNEADLGVQPAWKKDVIHYVNADEVTVTIFNGEKTILSEKKYKPSDEDMLTINIIYPIRPFIEDIQFNNIPNSVKSTPVYNYEFTTIIDYTVNGTSYSDRLVATVINNYSNEEIDNYEIISNVYRMYNKNIGVINKMVKIFLLY